VYQEVQVTPFNTNEWKLPLNLAVGLHVMLVLTAIYMPGLFHTKPIIPEIYTVNLINIGEAGPKEGGGPKQEPAPVVKKAEAAKPEVKVKPVEIKQPDPPPPQPVVKPNAVPAPEPPPPDAVSLAPLKRKLLEDAAKDKLINERIRKLEIQQKQKQEIEKKKELENIRRQRTAEAVRAERIAEEEARNAAEELKHLLRTTSGINKSTARESTGAEEGSGEGPKSSNNTSALESQYQAAIASRLQRFWALPEYKKWDPSLTAVIIVTINQEGAITNQYFESRSGDKVFDSFVEKTLRDAAPLPAIPPALRKSQYEFGFRFSPSGIR
jgi:colicin import membrane protein